MELCCIGILFLGIICFALMGISSSLGGQSTKEDKKTE